MNEIGFILVGGCGRSGTTLVQKLLITHDQISGGPEFGYGVNIVELYKAMQHSVDMGMMNNYISDKNLKEKFQQFYLSFFENYKSEKTSFISEKTPSNIFAAEELLKLIPNARYINVYRDGRAVLASHLKVKERAKKKRKYFGELSVGKICRLWNNSINVYFQLTEKSQLNSRLLNIQYESLILNPKTELKQIFDFFGLDYHERMLSPETIAFNDDKHDAHINDIWYTKEMYNQSYNEKNIDKWKKELNFIIKFRGSVLMARNLKKLGYSIPKFYLALNSFNQMLSPKEIKNKIRKSWVFSIYRKIRGY